MPPAWLRGPAPVSPELATTGPLDHEACHDSRVASSLADSFDSALRSLADLPGIAPAGTLVTAPDEVHLWYAFTDDAREPALIAAYDAMQTDEERARQARYVQAKDRDLHRLTRALQRTVLSRYAKVLPRDWVFARDAYDKPSVCGPSGAPWPRFNLSNTEGLVACAVSTTVPLLGVDVEPTTRRIEVAELADRFFSPVEAADLRSQPPALQAMRFFTYWTLKESYIKACGQGLSIPLDQFTFHLAASGEITVSFDPRLADDPAAWRYRLFRASDHHLAAVAARVGPGRELIVKAARCTPLRDALAHG